MRSQPSWKQLGGRVGALVVAGRDRRAARSRARRPRARGRTAPVFGSQIAHLEAGDGLAEQWQPPRPLVLRVDGLRHALGLEHATVDDVDDHAPHRRRERARDRHLGHAERAEHARPAVNPCGAAAATNASTASGSMGSAPFSAMRIDERSRPLIRFSARVASTHEKFGPAVAVPR